MLQDIAGAGNHGGSLVFSTAAAGLSGSLQDWLTIASTGMSTFSGELALGLSNSTKLKATVPCLMLYLLISFAQLPYASPDMRIAG